MGKVRATKKGAETPSTPTSPQRKTRTSGKKYTEKEIMNVLQYILDHYEDWINKKINQRTIIIKTLDHYDMKDRTPYAIHFKVSRLQFEYKNYGKINGFSSIINDMVARILKGNVETDYQREIEGVDTFEIKQELVSYDEQFLEDDRNKIITGEIKDEFEIRKAISKEDSIFKINKPFLPIMTMNEPKEITDFPAQAEKLNVVHNLKDYYPNKEQEPEPLLGNSSGITSTDMKNPNGPITYQHEPQMSNKFTFPCTQMSSDKNNSYFILTATYTFMEKTIVDEIYKRKLCEIREKYQGIRNENNRKEFKQISKLNQSYTEIICLLGRIEARMVEMQTKG
ncbi:12759_t:CDS:2 [Funneliformis caledonium]|uniref:12759_t:CDS:1 n=1 Tax=Funneliformis caledonium TaxID=1117310 RepID=A0A9N8V4S3_9GLOM|nr:12759_t:CDS:2 [Funneliformis caledonium]